MIDTLIYRNIFSINCENLISQLKFDKGAFKSPTWSVYDSHILSRVTFCHRNYKLSLSATCTYICLGLKKKILNFALILTKNLSPWGDEILNITIHVELSYDRWNMTKKILINLNNAGDLNKRPKGLKNHLSNS